MKKHILGFCLLAFLALPSQAENDRMMSISIAPISPIAGGASLLFQVKINDYLAITVPGYLYYFWPSEGILKLALQVNHDVPAKQTQAPIVAGGGLGARFLLANKGLNDSFYLEPRVTLEYDQFGFDIGRIGKFDAKFLSLMPMARLGYDWYYDSGFYLSLGGGIGFRYFIMNNAKYPDTTKDDFGTRAVLHNKQQFALAYDLAFMLGYAW